MASDMEKLMYGFIAIIVGVALINPLQTFCDEANVSGATALIVTLIPLIFALGIMYACVKNVVGTSR